MYRSGSQGCILGDCYRYGVGDTTRCRFHFHIVCAGWQTGISIRRGACIPCTAVVFTERCDARFRDFDASRRSVVAFDFRCGDIRDVERRFRVDGYGKLFGCSQAAADFRRYGNCCGVSGGGCIASCGEAGEIARTALVILAKDVIHAGAACRPRV